jgi:hypothetical protein
MDGALAIEQGSSGAREAPFGLAGSLLFHAALLVALFTLTPMRDFVVPEPAPISVELIPVAILEPPAPPELAPQNAAPVADEGGATPGAGPADTSTAAPDGTITATSRYAGRLLKEPAMAQVRRTLPTLASADRLMQLCNIEALEQIRRAAPQYEPDTMVSYAMADPVSAGLAFTAPGGAFRSRRQWYAVSFACVASPALDGVTSFSFRLGAAIPADQWEAHSLNAEDEDE